MKCLICILLAWREYLQICDLSCVWTRNLVQSLYLLFGVKKYNNKVLNRCKRFPQGDPKSASMQQSCVFHRKHHLKIASTYFLSIRTWTFLLLTRLSLLWRFWKGNSKKIYIYHWWERSVCLRREPLPKEENSGKTTTFSLTTSTMAFQIRPTAEAGNRHVLAVRRVHDRQHTGPMFNITPAIICFLWPGPTHVHTCTQLVVFLSLF